MPAFTYDMLGFKKGKLEVIKKESQYWICKCECGNIVKHTGYFLRATTNNSIGCMECYRNKQKTQNSPCLVDLTGLKFNNWTVLRLHPVRTKTKQSLWVCQCECGNIRTITNANIKNSKQCRDCVGRKDKSITAIKHLMSGYRSAAKKRGIIWELTEDQFKNITSSNCFYTGLPPSFIFKSGKGVYIYNGIDRIDSSFGYTIDNCVPCNGKVNVMKMGLKASEFIELCNLVSKNASAAQINANSSLIYQALN